MPVGCRQNSKGLYWPVFFCHSHPLPLQLSFLLKQNSENLDFLDMSEDMLSLVSQVCLNKVPIQCQGRRGKQSISPWPFMKLLKMGRAAFTMMRDTRMNLDKYKRSCEIEKAY